MPNYRIIINGNIPKSITGHGVFSASNAHTALSRAITGVKSDERISGPSHIGPLNDRLEIGEELTIKVRRI